MVSNVIKVGDKIELSRIAHDSSEQNSQTKSYVSKLLDIRDEKTLYIAVPIEGGRLIPLEIGARFEMRIITGSGIYVSRITISRRFKENNLYFLEVMLLTNIQKSQRRQYFRLETALPLQYRRICEVEEKIQERIEQKQYADERELRALRENLRQLISNYKDAVMINISAGGVKFSAVERLEADERIIVKFALDDEDAGTPMSLMARVIAADRVYNPNMQLYAHRTEFLGIEREDRERIVRYVFREERLRRQREYGEK